MEMSRGLCGYCVLRFAINLHVLLLKIILGVWNNIFFLVFNIILCKKLFRRKMEMSRGLCGYCVLWFLRNQHALLLKIKQGVWKNK